MMFQTGIWLWLCIGQNVLRGGGGLNCQKQHTKIDCYQLNRVHCSFRGAQYYCHRQGGQLMSTWNQDIRDRLRDYLEEGRKWWIGPGSDPLIKHERKGDPEVSANLFTRSGLSPPNRCTYVIRNWDLVSSEEDFCSKEHFFICQGDAFQDNPQDNHESDGKDARVNPTSKKKKWGISKMRNEIVSDHHLSSRCYRFTDIHQPTIVCQETSTNILVSSEMAQTPEQILLAISSPAGRQHLPMTTKFSKPLSEMSSEKPVSEAPATPKEPPYLHVFTADPQVFSEAMGNINRSIHDFHLVQKLQRACEILQELNEFASQFSKTVQTSATNSLLYLNEQLLKVQSPGGNPFSLKAPIALCSFDSFNSLDYDMEGSRMSQVGDQQDLMQMEDTLETSLIALGKIQEALLLASEPSESSMIVTSSLATLMLRSQNISTLSSSSYTLGCPAPLRLGFLSASALDNLLSKHQSVNIQVTGLAFNPFKYFDEQDIVGSIGNVLLTSNHKSLQIQDLLEEAEIILWRDGSIEIYPTSFNMSTDCFVIIINITSPEESLIVWVEPENPLSVTLYLGFQYQPNVTHFHLNITLPKEQTWEKDEKYSWVLPPENLQNGTGTYYITAVVNEIKKDPERTVLRFSVTTAATQCYFWDHHNKTWKSNGCRVGPQSTITKTQCLCNHLASFGSSFMALPRMVNVQDTVKLFHGVSRNPVGVSLLASLMGFYIIFVVWAWRKDREDRKKMKVTILADNSPNSQAYYLVQVFTGYRRRAATTAKVILILYGSEGRSDPHHLSDPHKAVFEQGAQDVFLLTTRSPLGELHSIRLWHDNSGTSPSWYVNQVIVSDLATRKKWYFLCNCWLAVDLGDCQQDQVFTSVSKKELFSFRNLYSSMIVEKFTQEHLWLSVVTCSPWNQVTRVQRLSCCMTLLICSMVINIMFWKLNSTEEDDRTVQDRGGPFAVTWSELLISIQTASILFPINLIIGRIFPLIQPLEKIPAHFIPIQAPSTSDTSFGSVTTQKIIEELKETVGFLHMKNACSPSEWEGSKGSCHSVTDLVKGLSSLIHSHLERQGSQWQQTGSHLENEVPENLHNLNHYLLRVLERLQFQCSTLLASPSGKPHDFLYSASQLQSIRELLETHILSMAQGPCSDITSFPMLDSEEEKSTISNYLPKWSIYICWLLLGVTSLVSAFFTVLYSLKLNKDQATSWVISMVLSVLQNIFIIHPVKVIIFTLFFSLLLTRIPWRNKEQDQQMRRILALLAKCPSLSPPGLRDENNPIYRVPPVKRTVKAPERTMREKQLFQLAREIFVQILFLVMLMISTHSERNHNKFYLNQAIQKRIKDFEEIRRIKDFYQWTNNILIPNLYGEYKGFIAEGNSFLIGSVQIRQIRIPDTISFPNRISPSEQVKPYYQHHQEDQKNYGAHWTPLDLNSTNQESIWCHQSEEALGGYPIQGQFAVYSGGGYVVALGNNSEDANRILQQLKQSHWLDSRTTSLFVAFVVYNANVNLFCVVTLILESNGVGAFFSSIKVNSLQIIQTHRDFIWFITSKVIYFLLLLYHIFTQGNRLKQQRWEYFTKKSNALDTSLILISSIMLALQLKCFFLHKRDMEQYRHNKSRFISFHETVQVSCALTYLVGFLVLLTSTRLWSLLRLSPRLRVISTTLKRAWDEVAGFLLIIVLLLTGYSIAFNILFGWSISDYRTFFNSAVTIVGLLMGIFDYQEVVDLDPVLGSFLIITIVILLVLVVINLFVSAIMLTFCKERKSIMAQKEAPLTEILLQKLSNLLGIRRPQKAVLPEQTDPTATGTTMDASEDETA